MSPTRDYSGSRRELWRRGHRRKRKGRKFQSLHVSISFSILVLIPLAQLPQTNSANNHPTNSSSSSNHKHNSNSNNNNHNTSRSQFLPNTTADPTAAGLKIVAPTLAGHSSSQIQAESLKDGGGGEELLAPLIPCLLYTSPSPRDRQKSRMPSSA